MITAHLKKLRLRSEISADEEKVIRGLVAETRNFRADEPMVRSGAELQSSMLLLDGWAVRSKDLPSGDRQITEIHVPGDFPDLHGFTLKRLDHDVMSVTESVVGIVPFERLTKLTDEWPHLTRVYWLATNIDAAITRETALSLGQRSAISRMAHLFCELHARLSVIGRTDGDSFEFPLTQRELGEALGLTVVHVNRTLQLLRKKGLVESQNRNVAILDRRGLETIADFDPAYLQLRRRQLG